MTAIRMPEQTTTLRETIERAVLTLAGRCDGAQTTDGQGYNRFDAEFGRDASVRIERGERIDLARAHRVVTKYRKQLAKYGIELPETEAVEAEAARETAERAARSPAQAWLDGSTAARIVRVDENLLNVAFPYDAAKVEAVKMIPGRLYDGMSRSWTVPFHKLSQLLDVFPDAIVDGQLGEQLAKKRAEREAIANRRRDLIARAMARYERDAATLKRTPFEHQDVGIRWMIEHLCGIVADDMGLGKTTETLLAARAIGLRTWVLCPAGLRENWRREAEACETPIEIFSWAKVPEPLETVPYVLIADEAHYAQNMKSQRTKAFLELAKHAVAVFPATGTPIKNGRPTNLFPLLVAVRHELGQDRRAYERRYCNAGPTRWTKWDVSGASHLDELHARTSDAILRRTKDDCLDLPEKTRVLRTAELSAAAREVYDTEFRRLQADYHARKIRGEIGEADALVLMNHLRHAGSLAKVEEAITIAEEVVEQGGKIVLFTAFKDSAAQLVQVLRMGHQLRVGTVTGDDDTHARQAAIDAFQTADTDAMVCTLGAGNVGITLTAAQTVVLVDRPWTPGDAIQAEDRLHRIGQKNAVTAIWLQHGEGDAIVDAKLTEKYEKIQMVLTGEASSLHRGETTLNILELADKVFGRGR